MARSSSTFVEVRIPGDTRWLHLVRLVVEQCCQEFEVEKSVMLDIKLAVDEAVSNVMRHAYGGDAQRFVHVALRLVASGVETEICDDGLEFDPFAQELPPPDELRSGGRGIFLMRAIMDECEYDRVDGWNRIRMRKHLATSTVDQ